MFMATNNWAGIDEMGELTPPAGALALSRRLESALLAPGHSGRRPRFRGGAVLLTITGLYEERFQLRPVRKRAHLGVRGCRFEALGRVQHFG